jgi:hypothetical protein
MRARDVPALVAVAVLGLSAGAMLAEGAVMVPHWRSLPPPDFLGWYAANAARLLRFFGSLEIAAVVFALAAAAVPRAPGRGRLALAGLLAFAVLVPFPLYFQAVNASFADGTIAHDALPGELGRWAAWHWGRTALGVGAFVAGLLALGDVRRAEGGAA